MKYILNSGLPWESCLVLLCLTELLTTPTRHQSSRRLFCPSHEDCGSGLLSNFPPNTSWGWKRIKKWCMVYYYLFVLLWCLGIFVVIIICFWDRTLCTWDWLPPECLADTSLEFLTFLPPPSATFGCTSEDVIIDVQVRAKLICNVVLILVDNGFIEIALYIRLVLKFQINY